MGCTFNLKNSYLVILPPYFSVVWKESKEKIIKHHSRNKKTKFVLLGYLEQINPQTLKNSNKGHLGGSEG